MNDKLKITMLMGVNSRNSGGLFNTVKNLCFGLKKSNNVTVNIMSYSDQYSDQDLLTYGDINMIEYSVTGITSLGYTRDLNLNLNHVNPDIIHQQGIWMYYSKCAIDYCKKNKNTKLIIQPHGMLDPWAVKNSRFKKKVASFFYQNKNLKRADCIHALCKSEYNSIRDYGLLNPVAIIPNGIDLPSDVVVKSMKTNNKKVLLFLGRIHPKKGLENLIEALNIIKNSNPNIINQWVIKIAGWSQANHEEELMSKVKKYKLNDLVKFTGPVYEDLKSNILLEADAFILPSFSEGLPMSILEAWSYKLPVLMTDECNIPEGFDNSAIRIRHSPDEMSKTLIDFFQISTEKMIEMGDNGYNLVKSNYTWNKVADDTLKMYNWLNGETQKPEFVFLD